MATRSDRARAALDLETAVQTIETKYHLTPPEVVRLLGEQVANFGVSMKNDDLKKKEGQADGQ